MKIRGKLAGISACAIVLSSMTVLVAFAEGFAHSGGPMECRRVGFTENNTTYGQIRAQSYKTK